MPITVEQHRAWQNNPDAARVILVVATAYDIDAAVLRTFYLSSIPFQTKSGDSITAGFDPRLAGDFEISYRIPFLGESRGDSGLGSLQIANGDGALDSWLYYAWGGRSLTVLWGDPTWGYDDFAVAPLLQGFADRIAVNDDSTLELFFTAITGELNR